MKGITRFIGLAWIMSAGVLGPVYGQENSGVPAAVAETTANKDAKIVSKLIADSYLELLLLQKMQHRATDEELKNVTMHMLGDHQNLDQQLRNYASAHGYQEDVAKRDKAAEKSMKWNNKKAGQEWDHDAIESLVDMHKDGIDMLEKAQADATDQELRTLIATSLPMVRSHLDMLTPLKERLKSPAKTKSNTDQ